MTTALAPELERHCGSWVVVDRATGEAVMETFSRVVADAINQTRYRVVTAAAWLASLNAPNAASQQEE